MLLDNSPEELDWVFISPAGTYGAWVTGELTGTYRLGGEVALFDQEGGSDISGADLALAVVDEIETALPITESKSASPTEGDVPPSGSLERSIRHLGDRARTLNTRGVVRRPAFDLLSNTKPAPSSRSRRALRMLLSAAFDAVDVAGRQPELLRSIRSLPTLARPCLFDAAATVPRPLLGPPPRGGPRRLYFACCNVATWVQMLRARPRSPRRETAEPARRAHR
jgi:hypothetical protein